MSFSKGFQDPSGFRAKIKRYVFPELQTGIETGLEHIYEVCRLHVVEQLSALEKTLALSNCECGVDHDPSCPNYGKNISAIACDCPQRDNNQPEYMHQTRIALKEGKDVGILAGDGHGNYVRLVSVPRIHERLNKCEEHRQKIVENVKRQNRFATQTLRVWKCPKCRTIYVSRPQTDRCPNDSAFLNVDMVDPATVNGMD